MNVFFDWACIKQPWHLQRGDRRHNLTYVEIKTIKYWLKTITLKTNPLVYKLYGFQYEKCKLEHVNNWGIKVKEMLNNLGFNYAWINQNVNNTFTLFLNNAINVYRINILSKWNISMSSSPDRKLHRLIKEYKICSNYMKVIKVQKHKFTYINCNITVVSGKWYHRKVYNERICTACNVLGDEYHFFIGCKTNANIRNKYLAHCYWRKSSMYKFVELMTCVRRKIIFN